MNWQMAEIVEEVCLFNNDLSFETTLEEFKVWIDAFRGADKEWHKDHPNFALYAKSPGFYWPAIHRYLIGK